MARLLAQVSEWLCGDFHIVRASTEFCMAYGTWHSDTSLSVREYNKHPEWLRQLLQASFRLTLSAFCVRKPWERESLGDRDCIYSAAESMCSCRFPSDSPPPLAAAAGLDPAVVGRFKNFCHSKPIVEWKLHLKILMMLMVLQLYRSVLYFKNLSVDIYIYVYPSILDLYCSYYTELILI